MFLVKFPTFVEVFMKICMYVYIFRIKKQNYYEKLKLTESNMLKVKALK